MSGQELKQLVLLKLTKPEEHEVVQYVPVELDSFKYPELESQVVQMLAPRSQFRQPTMHDEHFLIPLYITNSVAVGQFWTHVP